MNLDVTWPEVEAQWVTTCFDVSWTRNCSWVPRVVPRMAPAQRPWVWLEITEVVGRGEACTRAWNVWVWTGTVNHTHCGTGGRSKCLISEVRGTGMVGEKPS